MLLHYFPATLNVEAPTGMENTLTTEVIVRLGLGFRYCLLLADVSSLNGGTGGNGQ